MFVQHFHKEKGKEKGRCICFVFNLLKVSGRNLHKCRELYAYLFAARKSSKEFFIRVIN